MTTKKTSTKKPQAPKARPLSRVLKLRLAKLAKHDTCTVDDQHKITLTVPLKTYIEGLMLMSRVVVLATVLGVEPQFTLTNTTLKITIGSSKETLSEHDIELAERIIAQLSTDRRSHG